MSHALRNMNIAYSPYGVCVRDDRGGREEFEKQTTELTTVKIRVRDYQGCPTATGLSKPLSACLLQMLYVCLSGRLHPCIYLFFCWCKKSILSRSLSEKVRQTDSRGVALCNMQYEVDRTGERVKERGRGKGETERDSWPTCRSK